MLRKFEHMERMEEDWLVKRIVGSDVKGVKLRGKPHTRWLHVVKRVLNEREMFVEQEKMIVHDRSECIIHD